MAKKQLKSKPINSKIIWSAKEVNVADVLPTPNNYKIKTELGKQLLQTSLNKFGLAGTAVVNPDGKGKYYLIDGNSRREEAIENEQKKMWVSIPNKALSKSDFEEMSAIFDYAVAGQVDTERIKKEKGRTKDFFDRWGFEVPLETLAKLGSKSDLTGLTYPGGSKKTNGAKLGSAPVAFSVTVSLFFSEKEEKEFRKIEEKLAKKFSTKSTTDTVLKALKSIK